MAAATEPEQRMRTMRLIRDMGAGSEIPVICFDCGRTVRLRNAAVDLEGPSYTFYCRSCTRLHGKDLERLPTFG